MVGEIATALTSLKTAFDIAKGINEIAKSADIQSAVIGLQSQILNAQQYAMAAGEREAELKAEIARLESKIQGLQSWAKEQRRYELLDLRRGFYAFVLKESEQKGVPVHALCANCFGKGTKSILQTNGQINVHQHAWNCMSCKSSFPSQWKDMATLVAEVRSGPVANQSSPTR